MLSGDVLFSLRHCEQWRRCYVYLVSLDFKGPLIHPLDMDTAFLPDTALNDHQFDLILCRYDQVKDLPIHRSLVEKANIALERQENRVLFELFDQGFKELGPLYPLVLIYVLHPAILALYDRLEITEAVRQATLSDIAIWVRTYEDQHSGFTGLDRYGWICRHLCAKILQLGRLQFEPGVFTFPYSIYYDNRLMKYRTFANEGLMCTSDGYIGVSSSPDHGTWSTTYTIENNLLIAHEINQKLGSISREPLEALLCDLILTCTQDTPVLSVHVPEGEPLTPSLVDTSFHLAKTMFSPTLFVCDSWLLDPELLKVLPAESNICNFMNRFQKFPVTFSNPQIFERVFGFGAIQSDILGWKCTTSLQRKVQGHITSGGIFRTMGGYIPASLIE